MAGITITELWVYPVKSLKGIALQEAQLTTAGLAHDRRWMLVDKKGKFMSQRGIPRMALIETALTETHLLLNCQGQDTLAIPLDCQHLSNQEAGEAKVWKDDVQVLDEGDEAANWLSNFLGKTVRLVRMAENFERPQSSPDLLGAETHTYFADAAPLLICNQRSLDTLNEALVAKGFGAVPMNRFRPNIVIDGLPAFQEHTLKTLSQASISLTFCYACERCVMTIIDQSNGTKHPDWEPYRTLTSINPMPSNPKAPAFGENMIVAEGAGQCLKVGDVV